MLIITADESVLRLTVTRSTAVPLLSIVDQSVPRLTISASSAIPQPATMPARREVVI